MYRQAHCLDTVPETSLDLLSRLAETSLPRVAALSLSACAHTRRHGTVVWITSATLEAWSRLPKNRPPLSSAPHRTQETPGTPAPRECPFCDAPHRAASGWRDNRRLPGPVVP